MITRTFGAPRSHVWATFTEPRHLPNWHTGPEGFTIPICEVDLRPGGSWHYVWRKAQGREATGTYREIDPPRCFVTVMDVDGKEQTTTTTFTEANGRTTVTVCMLLPSAASRDQALKFSKMGTESSHARLDAYLTSMR